MRRTRTPRPRMTTTTRTTEHMQINEQVNHEWDCIFSKKTKAQWKPNIKCSTCHAGKNRGSRMRVCERCGRLHCAQSKPPGNKADKSIAGNTAENKDPQLESDNRAALDKLLRQNEVPHQRPWNGFREQFDKGHDNLTYHDTTHITTPHRHHTYHDTTHTTPPQQTHTHTHTLTPHISTQHQHNRQPTVIL